jgi:serine/threonine-protein kinase
MKVDEHGQLARETGDDTAAVPKGVAPPADAGGGVLVGVRIPAVGEIVGSKYRIEGVVGRGGAGIVLAARHVPLGERVAIKVLLLDKFARSGDFRSRFTREAQIAARLRNEHIARVVDFAALDDGTPYMVMEYADGVELREILRRDGKLPIARAVEYTVQACEGLAEAHANGIVHRDLKPPNFIITARPDGSDLLKILDFGISKLMSPEQPVFDLTETGTVMGSPKYMSPEQFGTAASVDTRVDVWALGVILYEMLAGEIARVCARVTSGDPPPSLRERRADVPEALERAILASLALDRDERTQNVADLAGDILAAIGDPQAESRAASIRATLGRGLKESGHRVASLSAARARPSTGSGPRRIAKQSYRSGPLLSIAALVVVALLGVVAVRQLARRAPPTTAAVAASGPPEPTPAATVSRAVVAPGAEPTDPPPVGSATAPSSTIAPTSPPAPSAPASSSAAKTPAPRPRLRPAPAASAAESATPPPAAPPPAPATPPPAPSVSPADLGTYR